MSNKSKIKKPKELLRLDFGAGQSPAPGYKSVDFYTEKPDFKVDLFQLPLPWKTESVEEINASHFCEHLPREIRWPFFSECWRILKPDGIMKIVVPSFKSERAYGDQSHIMPPIVPMFFYYLSKDWREANKLTHGHYAAIKCNFSHTCGPTGVSPEFAQRNQEVQVFACSHYWEAFPDCWATLIKKPL